MNTFNTYLKSLSSRIILLGICMSFFSIASSFSQAPTGNRGVYFDDDAQITTNLLPLASTDNFTLSFWIKKQADQIGNVIYNGTQNTNGYGVNLDATGKISVELGGVTSLVSDISLVTNEWTYISVIRDNGTWSIYKNATAGSFTSGVITSNPISPIGNFQFGKAANTTSFVGQLDEVKIFVTARTTINLAADMNATALDGATSFWRFEEATGTAANDVSTNFPASFATGTSTPLWTLRVQNTNDAGAESFRQIIIDANNIGGKNYIDFSIPTASPWVISIASNINGFDGIQQQVLIDASSQLGFQENTAGKIVTLKAINNTRYGLIIESANVEIYGLQFTEFRYPIRFTNTANNFRLGTVGKGNVINLFTEKGITTGSAIGGIISSNKVGTDETGTIVKMNDVGSGIEVRSNNSVENNIISSCTIFVSGSNITIRNNHIGTGITGNETGFGDPSNSSTGISVNSNPGDTNNLIENNVIGNFRNGISLSFNSESTIVKDNKIGVGKDGTTNIGNFLYGIRLSSSGNNCTITGNTIAYTQTNVGINVTDVVNNKISQNSIYLNNIGGIALSSGGNNSKTAPLITAASTSSISGTGQDGDIIEIFENNAGESQGRTYKGNVTVTGTTWTFSPLPALTVGKNVTATATDATNNTSTFSAAATITSPEINIRGAGTDIANGSTNVALVDDTDFDKITTSGTSSFTIQNTGTGDLVVTAINIIGANATDFRVSNITLPATITPTNSIMFNIIFEPVAIGVSTADCKCY